MIYFGIKHETIIHISEFVVEENGVSEYYITYNEIGGLDEEIQQIREIIELPIKHPSLFKKLGIKPSKGILLTGPSGCGKTLIAKAVANESFLNFIPINGPEILSKFYGESEKKLSKIFIEAEEKAPSIIYIDQLDSIGYDRKVFIGRKNYSIISQLLSLMDGLNPRGKVFVIGATNKLEYLDQSLRRPGRFDTEIKIGLPDKSARRAIFGIHTREIPLSEDISLDRLSEKTENYTGADISDLCRRATLNAIRRSFSTEELESDSIDENILDQIKVSSDDFENALKSGKIENKGNI